MHPAIASFLDEVRERAKVRKLILQDHGDQRFILDDEDALAGKLLR